MEMLDRASSCNSNTQYWRPISKNMGAKTSVPVGGSTSRDCTAKLSSHYDALAETGVQIPERGSSMLRSVQHDRWRNCTRKGKPHPCMEVEPGTNLVEFVEEMAIAAAECEPGSCSRVCEIGFNAGVSSLAWLCAAPHAQVHAFDIGEHPYSQPAATLIESAWPGRHTVTWGRSTATLPSLADRVQGAYCDFAFIDGSRAEVDVTADILNLARLASPNSIVILENCNSWGAEHGWGGFVGVNQAYLKALNVGVLAHVKQVSLGPCGQPAGWGNPRNDMKLCREMCVARFMQVGSDVAAAMR